MEYRVWDLEFNWDLSITLLARSVVSGKARISGVQSTEYGLQFMENFKDASQVEGVIKVNI